MRSCARVFLLFIVVLAANDVSAQVGRHELPIDTIPMGGEEQKRKTREMQGRDMVIRQVIDLRDSVGATLHVVNQRSSDILDVNKQRFEAATRELTRQKNQLAEIVESLQSDSWKPEETEKSFEKLKAIRREFYRIRNDVQE